ncbi:uncharacterized protein LOC103714441 isoform X4 [Phoenix dactylifera]|uniref:Uncharacterized protein LOC103714441 isoform X4 n=1 Tax=Phoenix dactylifera TaxID=42345 RepID=A0A8B8J948_PHODC|nr:uncharacterized protein LOC103714441 isoform X4 [Phoenix dactylifera]
MSGTLESIQKGKGGIDYRRRSHEKVSSFRSHRVSKTILEGNRSKTMDAAETDMTSGSGDMEEDTGGGPAAAAGRRVDAHDSAWSLLPLARQLIDQGKPSLALQAIIAKGWGLLVWSKSDEKRWRETEKVDQMVTLKYQNLLKWMSLLWSFEIARALSPSLLLALGAALMPLLPCLCGLKGNRGR